MVSTAALSKQVQKSEQEQTIHHLGASTTEPVQGLNALFNLSSDACLGWLEGQDALCVWNAAMASLLGWCHISMLGKSLADFLNLSRLELPQLISQPNQQVQMMVMTRHDVMLTVRGIYDITQLPGLNDQWLHTVRLFRCENPQLSEDDQLSSASPVLSGPSFSAYSDSVIERLGIGLVMVEDDQIVSANARAGEILGKDCLGLSGVPFSQFFSAENIQEKIISQVILPLTVFLSTTTAALSCTYANSSITHWNTQ